MPTSKSSIDHRDVYYRKGKSAGYRARSAYKLLHLDEEFDLFSAVETAVDLCAAPGSWSQVLGQRLKPSRPGEGEGSKVVSVDLQPMAPLSNITILQTDITLPSTIPLVLDALGGRKADLVVCDGAPDVTGVHDLDAYLHSQLLLAAITLSLTLLAPRSTLIFKIFLSPLDPQASLLCSQLRCFFPSPPLPTADHQPEYSDFSEESDVVEEAMIVDVDGGGGGGGGPGPSSRAGIEGYDFLGRRGGVWVRKPRSSRAGSGEAFVVCRNFDSSKVPLPSTFSSSALEDLRRQTAGTLTLKSLSSLGLGLGEGQESREWEMIKAYVGGGDLNAMSGPSAPSRPTHPPPISLQVTTSPSVPPTEIKEDLSTSPSSPKALFAHPTPLPLDAPPEYFSPKGSPPQRPALLGEPSTSMFLSTTNIRLDSASPKLNLGRRTPPSDETSIASANTTVPASPGGGDGAPTRQSSLESIKPSPTPLASATLPPPKSKTRIPPPPLPLPAPSESLGVPSRLRAWSNASSTGSASYKDDIFGSSPLLSPALSSSSKTDMFFATSQKDVLPAPPRPLPNAAQLGRGLPSSVGKKQDDRSVSMPVKSSREGIWAAQVGTESRSIDLASPSPSKQGWTEMERPDRSFGFEEIPGSSSRSRALSNPFGVNSLNPLSSSPTSNYSPTTTRLMKRIHEPLATLPTQADVRALDIDNPSGPTGPAGPSSPTAKLAQQDREQTLTGALGSVLRRPVHVRRESQQLEREHREAREDVSLASGDVVRPEEEDEPADVGMDVGDEEKKAKKGKGWRLERKLGEGAFSAVWSARPVDYPSTDADDFASASPAAGTGTNSRSQPKPTPTGKVAALKLMDRNLSLVDTRTRISFLREVEVLRHISHPSIVAYLDSFTTPSHHVLVLEQLDGGELFELMSEESNRTRMLLPSLAASAGEQGDGVWDTTGEGFVRRVFGELCRAVGWLHEVGVVHRDIKLENILFTINPLLLPPTSTNSIPLDLLPSPPAPLIKLTDFGLSRFISPSAPLLQTRCGSESFAAPEIIMGRPYDGRRTDAWAMGVVLYGLIFGELPFDREELSASTAGGTAGAGAAEGESRTPSHAPSVAADARNKGRKRMMRIAKGHYTYPHPPNDLTQSQMSGGAGGSQAVRDVIDSLLVRDSEKRAKVSDLWDLPWFDGPGGVVRPEHTLTAGRSRSGSAGSGSGSGPPTPGGTAGLRKRGVLDGFLVEEDGIAEVARAEH